LPPLGGNQESAGETAYSVHQMEMYPPSMSLNNEQKGFKAYIKKHLMHLRRGQASGDVFLPKNEKFDVWGGK